MTCSDNGEKEEIVSVSALMRGTKATVEEVM